MNKNFVNDNYTFSPRYYNSTNKKPTASKNGGLPYEHLSDEPPFEQQYLERQRKRRKIFIIVCVTVIVLMLLVICLFSTVLTPIIIMGESMHPTLKDSDVIFVSRLDTNPEFQEIVVYWHTNGMQVRKRVVKRCVGLPGDTIEIKKGILWRNGVKIEESYLGRNFYEAEYDPIILKEDCYFMLGDNRDVSSDSRAYGYVQKKDILGVKI